MSETGGRPPKRVRTNDGSRDPEPSFDDLTRDEEFWLDDGNIVLVAGKHAFKIYRGLLAMQSPVFSDMFAAASPNVGQLYDGCPAIHLSDSQEDLTHLLRALIPEGQSPEVALTNDFNQLSSLTRLGHKYQIGFLERRAIARLKIYYTDEFEKFLTMAPFNVYDGEAIEAIYLARLTDNHDMLPVALYRCSTVGGAVARGWTREDGTVETLNVDDLERCINGYGLLREETSSILTRLFQPPSRPKCPSSTACQLCLTYFYEKGQGFSQRHTHLDPWHPLCDDWIKEEDFQLCSQCREALKKRETDERRAIWRRLPTIYNLPTPDGWET